MPVLDFKEIPEAHIAGGMQDTFELFARDFLSGIGFRVLVHPDRGADGGRDLICEEVRVGPAGETTIKWLVSCKHKAHSGGSVSPQDEPSIRDRVEANSCDGFLGFYSTLPSAGLSDRILGLQIETLVFDREAIEEKLLSSSTGLKLAGRFFPKSVEEWRVENPIPAKIFSDQGELNCEVCGANLLEKKDKGIVTVWQKMGEYISDEPRRIEEIHWTCRGRCDDIIQQKYRSRDLIESWEDIDDVSIPAVFVKWLMGILNRLHSGEEYSEQAHDAQKVFLLSVFPYISRHLTEKEQERLKDLMEIPSVLGGMGD